MTIITQEQSNDRHFKRSDYVSCTVAFIDCKKPGSELKENYSIIGPGVTSSAEQTINLPEPHGFNIGAAAMPNGVVNNLHLHFTAEVFIVQKGEWTFNWGPNGEHSYVGREGDILSIPTWIFRGFMNSGPDDGWLFTVLGGDNTGGVVFHPDIIKEAAEYGLFISNSNTLIDTSKGDPLPEAEDTIAPMPLEEVDKLKEFTLEAMLERIVKKNDRDFKPAFIDGGGAELAPVIGHGITQNREHVTPINNPHGFSVEWLRIAAGQSISPFTLEEKMVLIMRKGKIRLVLNDGETVLVDLQEMDTYSIPGDVIRSFEASGEDTAEALVVVSGDHRKFPKFTEHTLQAAKTFGLSLDAGCFIANASLLPDYERGS